MSVDQTANGWPLGLQPLNVRFRLLESIRMADASSTLTSTPSFTSDSSSDLETTSTVSFFPEKSTTLGSLIGLHLGARSDEARDVTQQAIEAENVRRRSAAGRHCFGCSYAFLGCMSSDVCQENISSSSLAHLLELERRSSITHREEMGDDLMSNEQGFPAVERRFTTNTLFDNECILPPQPSGAPLKLILQQSSPNSSYLSADWSASVPVFDSDPKQDEENMNSSRLPTLCPSICGSLGTSLVS